MQRGTALAVVVGVALGGAAGFGEVSTQTNWLKEPIIASAAEWEPISGGETEIKEESTDSENANTMNKGASITVGDGGVTIETPEQIVITHDIDVIKNWWEVPGEMVNDPDIPDDIEEAAYIYGTMFNICPEFLEGVSNRETGGTYRCDLIDGTGTCYGCMQINVKAQAERIAAYGLTTADMLTADGAMLVAASYLSELFDQYIDPAVVLMKYNGAASALREYKHTGKLNGYTAYVLRTSAELERRHGK